METCKNVDISFIITIVTIYWNAHDTQTYICQVEDGVKGYFDFIQLPRYHNLRGIKDPEQYLETIKADGYATSSAYVESNMKLIRQYDLTRFDREEEIMGRTAQDLKYHSRVGGGIVCFFIF